MRIGIPHSLKGSLLLAFSNFSSKLIHLPKWHVLGIPKLVKTFATSLRWNLPLPARIKWARKPERKHRQQSHMLGNKSHVCLFLTSERKRSFKISHSGCRSPDHKQRQGQRSLHPQGSCRTTSQKGHSHPTENASGHASHDLLFAASKEFKKIWRDSKALLRLLWECCWS